MFVASAGAEAANTPRDIVSDTADKVLEALRQEPNLKDHPRRANAIIDELVVPHFDFVRMSRYVLEEYWDVATKDEKRQFVREFQTLLVRTYALALTEYTGQKVEIVSQDMLSDNWAKVRVQITTNGNGIVPMDYLMRSSGDVWKVIDVSVENVSVVKNHRASFRKEVEENGMAGLITRLSAQNWKDE